MAITNFVPELWESAVMVPYEESLVYGQPSVSNRDYEGQIREMGDTVHVTSIDAPTIETYSKTTNITVEDLTDSDSALVVDQGAYFAFRVNDVDAVQAAGNFRSPALTQAGIGIRDHSDTYLAGWFKNDGTAAIDPGHATNKFGPIPANRLGALTVYSNSSGSPASGQFLAFDVLVELGERLDENSVPTVGRYAVVPPAFHSALLRDDRFTRVDASGTSEGLRNGLVGRAVGFDVLVSNNNPSDSSGNKYVNVGVPGALSMAQQILSTEALREQLRFADIVRGLSVYGAKVFRPEGIATARVEIVGTPGSDESSSS
jgi:hypothetical protein